MIVPTRTSPMKSNRTANGRKPTLLNAVRPPRKRTYAPRPTPQPEPIQALLIELLSLSRADMIHLREKAERLVALKLAAAKSFTTLEAAAFEFVKVLRNCQTTCHWMFNPDYDKEAVGFEDACIAVGRDPDGIRDKMTEGLPQSLVSLVMRAPHARCPICGDAG
jgi:hypothetical protein